jgi:CHAT domain
MYPRLIASISVRAKTVANHPAVEYSLLRLLHNSESSLQCLKGGEPISLILSEKNKHINSEMTDIGASLKYNPLGNQTRLLNKLSNVGEWIANRMLPPGCFDCCSTGLPRSIDIVTDQADVPWELMIVGGKFLSEQVIHSRQAFIGTGRRDEMKFGPNLNVAIIRGKSANLSESAIELELIKEIFTRHQSDCSPTIVQGEEASPDVLSKLLTRGIKARPYDVIHFIGHGGMSDKYVWLELPSVPFLVDDVPASILGNPLIFWNACLSAGVGPSVPSYNADIVSGFGGRFIASGASHFIGSLLPVQDDTARRFATEFYTELLNCATVGEAVFSAKTKVGLNDRLVHAYTMYGNPALRIKSDA